MSSLVLYYTIHFHIHYLFWHSQVRHLHSPHCLTSWRHAGRIPSSLSFQISHIHFYHHLQWEQHLLHVKFLYLKYFHCCAKIANFVSFCHSFPQFLHFSAWRIQYRSPCLTSFHSSIPLSLPLWRQKREIICFVKLLFGNRWQHFHSYSLWQSKCVYWHRILI